MRRAAIRDFTLGGLTRDSGFGQPRRAPRLRASAWRGSTHIGHASIRGRSGLVRPSDVDRVVGALAARGFHEVVTSALRPDEQGPFLGAGFSVRESLHLLRRPLDRLPPPATCTPMELRRARRHHHQGVIDLDARAFSDFWRLDRPAMAEARRATPSSRFQVALLPIPGRWRSDEVPHLNPATDALSETGIGGYCIVGVSGSAGFLQRLAVDPRLQGHGLGTALVIDSLRWLRSRGARSCLVNTQESNTAAYQLYTRLGFVPEPSKLAILARPLPQQSPSIDRSVARHRSSLAAGDP